MFRPLSLVKIDLLAHPEQCIEALTGGWYSECELHQRPTTYPSVCGVKKNY